MRCLECGAEVQGFTQAGAHMVETGHQMFASQELLDEVEQRMREQFPDVHQKRENAHLN